MKAQGLSEKKNYYNMYNDKSFLIEKNSIIKINTRRALLCYIVVIWNCWCFTGNKCTRIQRSQKNDHHYPRDEPGPWASRHQTQICKPLRLSQFLVHYIFKVVNFGFFFFLLCHWVFCILICFLTTQVFSSRWYFWYIS